jgi:hypothetical protein
VSILNILIIEFIRLHLYLLYFIEYISIFQEDYHISDEFGLVNLYYSIILCLIVNLKVGHWMVLILPLRTCELNLYGLFGNDKRLITFFNFLFKYGFFHFRINLLIFF